MSSVPEWVLISLIAVLVVILLLTLFALAVYSGLLTEVEVRAGPPPIRGVVLAYKFRVGPYDESGNLYTENVSLAPKLVSIGVYYDNPMKVPVEFCRYIVGSILSEGDEKPLPDHVRIFRKHGFKFCVLPEVNHAVMATFPYTTPFSIQLATTRVHPALEKYVKERKLCAHPYLEIYKGDKIIFMCPLSRQDEFYVPEMKELLRKEKGETGQPEPAAELECLLPEEILSLDLVSESPEELEGEGAQKKRHADSERSHSESGASGSSFEELDLDSSGAVAKAQMDPHNKWSQKTTESLEKERAEE
ncbi:testis-expressed protein 264 homolog [Xenopus laevis]|uniref:Testis-expressed sequence 264 protein n=2 Tax=Xenopus laevis TaxID=8355 RepID=A0A974D7G7_XENLA|nr:testis-expressed protein 264 homolog [Xenopus laevis]OCT85686.1 hypothetical protein XELAEV_18023857mg [Xenopus laevis]